MKLPDWSLLESNLWKKVIMFHFEFLIKVLAWFSFILPLTLFHFVFERNDETVMLVRILGNTIQSILSYCKCLSQNNNLTAFSNTALIWYVIHVINSLIQTHCFIANCLDQFLLGSDFWNSNAAVFWKFIKSHWKTTNSVAHTMYYNPNPKENIAIRFVRFTKMASKLLILRLTETTPWKSFQNYWQAFGCHVRTSLTRRIYLLHAALKQVGGTVHTHRNHSITFFPKESSRFPYHKSYNEPEPITSHDSDTSDIIQKLVFYARRNWTR